MEIVLIQDSFWFLAAVAWLLAGVLGRWPTRVRQRVPRAERGWVLLCGLQFIAALLHLWTFDRGLPEGLLQADCVVGAVQILALVCGAWPGVLSPWLAGLRGRGLFFGGLLAQVVLWPAMAIALELIPPLLITDFLPWGSARSGLAMALGGSALVLAWRLQPIPRRRREVAPFWLAVVVVTGIGLAEWLAAQSRERTAEATVVRARSLVLALDEDALAALTLDAATHLSEPYRKLRAQILRLRRANPDVAYLYLLALHGGDVVYPVSGAEFYHSLTDEKKTRIPEQDEPYEVGPPRSSFYERLFAGKPSELWQFSSDPYYGSLLTAYAPIVPADGGKTRYVLALDVRSPTFLDAARQARRLAQALTLAGIAAVWVFLRYQINVETAEADRLARSEADRRERARNEFLGMISHELRTPVHAIIARTDALRQGSPVKETAAELDALAGDLQRLVEDLLQASALQSPSLRLQSRRCRLPAMLREVARVAERAAAVKGLAFSLSLSRQLPPVVRIDELRLRQVLVNLLSNAVKYTSAGEVRFAVNVIAEGTPGGGETGICRVECVVSDTGPGLSEEAQARLFEPFFRAQETAVQPGMGLGLTVARALSERLGGELIAEVGAVRGTVFTVRLPLLIEAEVVITEEGSATGRVALIVEDHPTLRLHLAEQVERLGWTVYAADTIAAAEARWDAQPPAVVFVDQQLPDGNGADWLARRLPLLEKRPWVIGMSASLEPQVAEALLAAGADDFLYKPIAQEALRDALELRDPAKTMRPAAGIYTTRLAELTTAIAGSQWDPAVRETHLLVNDIIAHNRTDKAKALQAARRLEDFITRRLPAESEEALRALKELLA